MFLVMYFWLGVFYVNFFYYEYVIGEIGSFGFWILFILFIFIVMWLLGYMIVYGFFIFFMIGLFIFVFIFFSILLFFQIGIIFCGQMLYERKKKKREYDFGWKQNFFEVFGDKWYLVWIWFIISLFLLGDGINYKKIYFDEIKDL